MAWNYQTEALKFDFEVDFNRFQSTFHVLGSRESGARLVLLPPLRRQGAGFGWVHSLIRLQEGILVYFADDLESCEQA